MVGKFQVPPSLMIFAPTQKDGPNTPKRIDDRGYVGIL